jgi:hypothetical protein
MITQYKESKKIRKVDNSKRPVIGVLTEPIRGDLFKNHEPIGDGIERVPGYVPRAHV